MMERLLEPLLRAILKPRGRGSQVWIPALWAITAMLGIFMIGRGSWALLQPWGSSWHKLFGLGFSVCVTGIALYEVIAAAARPASLIGAPHVEGLVYTAGALLLVVAGVFVVLSKEATAADVIAGTCGIVFFGVGAIVLIRRAREDRRRR